MVSVVERGAFLMTAALGFLFIMAVGGAICGLADIIQDVIDRLVAVSVTVTKQGGVNTSEYLVA